MLESIATTLGVIGVGMILIGYAMQQVGRMESNSLPYLWLNLMGAVLILFSLFFQFNLPSFIIEIAWISITLYGFWRRQGK